MMVLAKKIVLASLNPGKLKEFKAIFEPLQVELIAQQDLQIAAAAEPYLSFVENALGKARQASAISGLPSLADDSGICVNALNGAPGIYSARYAGPNANDAQNNAQLLKDLKHEINRQAKYVCALVYIRYPEDPEPIIATGSWFGEVIDEARGSLGFGYDPHFYLPDQKLTAAELDPMIRNQISHRARAIQDLLKKIHHE
jgi:XTP/dITP diphosphohydrolase